MLLGLNLRHLANICGKVWSKYTIIFFSLIAFQLSGQTFTQILTGPIVSDASASINQAWGDFDNDGDLDLFVPTYNEVDRFYINNGDGTFSQVTTGTLVENTTRGISAVWGDYDNDGFLDLFLTQADNWSNTLYHNNGDGSFTRLTTGAIVADGGNSYAAAWADYDLDGDLDIFVANYNGNNGLYRNNGDGTFSNVTTSPMASIGGEKCAWADYDNDGDPDIIILQGGANRLFRNNGDGSFSQVTSGTLPNATGGNPNWGDYDNDGDLDLILTRDGANGLYRNDGNGSFTAITGQSIVTDIATSRDAAWGDFDNNGTLDLYVANSGTNALYLNNGDGTFLAIQTGSVVTNSDNSYSVAAVDVQNNGALDIFVVNYSSQNNQLYDNDGNSNHWLAVDLTGGMDNTPGINSEVRLKAGGVWLTHQVLSNDSPLRLHFGLSNSTSVDSIVVNWPQGSTQIITDLVADQSITITQEDATPRSVKVINDPTLSVNYAGQGIAWGDYDNDGYPDLFVVTYNEVDRLYHNDGDGSFSPVTSGELVTTVTHGIDAAWGDYDNDGYLDLFIAQTDNWSNALYHNNTDGTFTRITTGAIVNSGGNSYGSSWMDFDQDGDLDLYVSNWSGVNWLYRNNGDATFTNLSTSAVATESANSSSAVWGDYDNDGDPDLFVTNESNNFLYRNNGDGTFTKILTGDIANDQDYSSTASWGDMDNDGDIDLFVGNYQAPNALYRNNGNGSFTRVTTGPIATDDFNANSSVWLDIDQDGDQDLYVACYNDVNNALYRNLGNGSFERVLTGSVNNTYAGLITDGGNSIGVAVADLDGSGTLDIGVVNNGTTPTIYQISPTGNNWLAQYPTGSYSSRQPVGTRVHSYATINGTSTHQIVNAFGQSGANSSSQTVAYIGLGDASSVDSLVVEWPSGAVSRPTNLSINSLSELSEPTTVPPVFEKLISGGISATAVTGYSASWGDYDADGDDDIYITVYNGNNLLYRNNGDGTFSSVTTGSIVTETSNSFASVWGDYDNDGWLDLFIANINQSNWLYHNDGGTFTRITTGSIVSDGSNSYGAAWGDYDNDGDEDLFVANYNGQVNFLYRNNGNGTFTSMTTGTPVVTDQEYSSSGAWGDYDNDGDLDLFVANNGTNALYKNTGDGSFSRVSTGDIANDAAYSISAAWGDMDNDGDLDLFVANYNDGTNSLADYLYRNDGNDTFTKVTSGAIVTQTRNSYGGSWGDVDNDGDLDLMVYQSDGNNRLFSNQGDGSFDEVLPGTNFGRLSGSVVTDGGANFGGGFSDYDDDGDLDLVVVNHNEPSAVYVGNGSVDNHWLTLSLEGRSSNRRATGARVTLTATINGQQVAQTRHVNTNPGGYGSQSSPLVHFGLGDALSVSGVTINWPSGQTWDTTGVFADQSLHIIETEILPQFEKITDDPVVESAAPSLGMAWSDYDQDGYPDLFVANYADYNGLYHNSGNGSFSKITTGDVVGITGNHQSGTWGDYDNDGYPDLYVTRSAQNNLLYHNNGDGTFSTVVSIPPTTYTYYSRNAAWGDFDNDGDLDLFIANSNNHVNELYINQGGGSFVSGISGAMASDYAYSRAASWCDYDLDGDLDLFVANENNSANRLYRNNGAGGFQSITTGDIVTATETSQTCSWGDYDNDGYPDLFVGNDASTGNALYHNTGNGTFTRITTGAIVTDQANSTGSGWADFDSDGDLDLLVANLNNNALYINQGDGSFIRASGAMAGQIGSIITDGGNSYGMAWADYDLNGTLDVAIANSGENNFLYKNNGSGNGWLTIRLHGTASSRDGTGARVEILSTIHGESVRQYRQISSQTGSSGESPNLAYFGLGDGNLVSQIRISWPSGVVWDTTTVEGNQLLDIWENAPDPVYTRITEGAIGTDQGNSYGANWADYDNDGDLDLFVTNYETSGAPNFLYRNNGDGSFTSVTDVPPVNSLYYSYCSTWGDYDSDGDLDLVIGTSYNSSNDALAQNDGEGNFSYATMNYISNLRTTTNGLAWGDADNDGFLDLFFANYAQPDVLLRNIGGSSFEWLSIADLNTAYTYSTSVRWVDYDADGKLDIFITNGNESSWTNFLWRNISTADSIKFSKITSGVLVNEGGYSRAQGWGDYDNDGDLDLYVANAGADSTKSKNFLYRNDGDGSFTKITTGRIVTDADESYGVAWGDIDSDGWLDLFVANTGMNAIYQNNHDGTFTRLRSGMPGVIMGSILTDAGSSHGSAFADYDADGDLDLYVANYGSANFLYKHSGTEKSWLVVKGQGLRSNNFADGSRVRVKATINGQSIWQTREVTSQSGGNSSSGLQAWFGLGTATRADSVIFIFPNSSRQIATQVTANQTITLTEPAAPIAGFTMDRSFGAPPLVIQFTDSSTGVDANVVGWSWDFGDGQTSTSQNPVHTFESEGTFTVRLTITDANGTTAYTTHTVEVAYFTKVQNGDLPSLFKVSTSASWVDYDNDGDDDIFVANYQNATNWLIRNDNAVFYNASPAPFNSHTGNTWSGHWADIDNDGDQDCLILDMSSYPKLIINNGDGSFSTHTGDAISNTYMYAYDATWVDYDRDGDLDLIVAPYGGYPLLFRCLDAANYSYEQVTGISLVESYRSYTSVNFIDFDQDGDLDCFYTTAGSGNFLYVNVGDTAFVAPESPINNDYPTSYGQAWGDYDNDGDLDLYIPNYGSTNLLYRNDGGTFTSITNSETLAGNSYSYTASWVDVNNDGWLDLSVSNISQSQDFFENDADGTFTRNTSLPMLPENSSTYQSVWGDYDLNGSMDVFTPNYNYSQANTLHRNNGNANHWAAIRLRGVESNSFGLNAKVRVKAKLNGVNARWQIREIGADVGGFGENSIIAHFGLQDAEIIDSLQVRWPGGLVQTYTQIPADQQLTVTESSGPPPELDWTAPNLGNVVVGIGQTWETDCQLKNTGTGTLTYDFVSNQSWLLVDDHSSDDVAPGDSVLLTIQIDAEDLDQGNYYGQLTLNTNDMNEATTQIPVTISVVRFSAFFEYSPSEGLAPLTVNFTDHSVSVDYSISDWSWDFGDGSQSTQQNPSHTYTAEGQFEVTLTIVDANSQQSHYTGGPITVTPTIIVAFMADDPEGGNPHTVHFTDLSIFKADTTNRSWTWDFGDGYQSGVRNPTHTYTQEGDYTVGLTVGDGQNTYNLVKSNYVTVRNYPNFLLSRTATDTVDMEIVGNDVQSDTLMIYNPGGLADLSFGTTESLNWLSVSPASGTVAPNDSTMIILQFTSTDLGVYTGSVIVYGNDENNTSVEVPVTMHVVEFPYLPAPFRAGYNANGSAIHLTWSDRSRIEDGYKLYRVNSSGRTLLWTAPPNATAFTDADVDTNQTWQYAITTFLNSRGESPVEITITVPAKPELASITRNGDVVTLTPASTSSGTSGLWAERWQNDDPPVLGGNSVSIGNVRDTINFGFAETFRYRVYAYGGNPEGSYGLSWPSDKITLPPALHGDFSGDATVDIRDAIYFVNSWEGENFVKETGPVTGTAPNFNFTPDGEFDRYDMAAFVGMYRYSAANLSSATLNRIALNHPEKIQIQYEPDETGLTVRLTGSPELPTKALSIWLEYDPQSMVVGEYSLSGWNSEIMALAATDFQPVNLGWILMADSESGQVTATIRLNHIKGGKYSSDVVVTGALLDQNAEFQSLNRTNTSVVYTPDEFVVESPYPNPFNPMVHVKYGMPDAGLVTISVYDIRGREVATLLNQTRSAGWYTLDWGGLDDQGRQVSTGVYFIRAQAAGVTRIQKVVYLK